MRLALAPIPYFWPRAEVYAFYERAAVMPVDVIYLGETVCSKRRELRTRDWLALAAELAAGGREVVLSTLALLEAESELSTLQRIVEEAPCGIEANDIAAVQLLRERRMPFVGGPGLAVYNAVTLGSLCEDGMRRLVLGAEHDADSLLELRSGAGALPEFEMQAWGRPALAHSARCFTARAHDLIKDDCGFRCLEHPDGLALLTREGAPFLNLNGIQVQGAERMDLGNELEGLRAAGVDLLRIQPSHAGTAAAVQRFRALLSALPAPGPAVH